MPINTNLSLAGSTTCALVSQAACYNFSVFRCLCGARSDVVLTTLIVVIIRNIALVAHLTFAHVRGFGPSRRIGNLHQTIFHSDDS